MVVDVDADELAKAPGSAEFSELLHESSGVFRQANDSTVDIHDECVWAIYLCTCRQTDIYNPLSGHFRIT